MAASLAARWPIRNRLLLAALCFAALSLVLGAVWLGLRDWTGPASPAPAAEPASQVPLAVLTSTERIEALGGSAAAFPLAVDGTDGVPAGSVIAIRGLPQGSNFSEGRPYGDSEWTLRPDQIGDLSLTLPAGANGEFKLSIALIAPNERVVAEAQTLLAVAPAPVEPVATAESTAGPPGSETAALPPEAALQAQPDSETAAGEGVQQGTGEAASEPVQTEPAEAALPAAPADAEADGTAKLEEEPIMMQSASVPSRAAPPDQDKPADSGTGLGSVQPAMFVNMRESPSSSSPVLGVIAKGAELAVLDRKRGWVQVAHPETGKQGWIYSGLLVGEAKANQRVRRVAPAETEAKSQSESESFWGRVGRWLSPSPEQSNAN